MLLAGSGNANSLSLSAGCQDAGGVNLFGWGILGGIAIGELAGMRGLAERASVAGGGERAMEET